MIDLTFNCFSLFKDYAVSQGIGILPNKALQPEQWQVSIVQQIKLVYGLKNGPLSGQYCCVAPRFESIRGGCHCLIELVIGCFRNTSEECLGRLLRRDHESEYNKEWHTRRTGSTTSIHWVVLLCTNSPPMKFLVFSPEQLVPFQSLERFSAFSRTTELSPRRGGCTGTVA